MSFYYNTPIATNKLVYVKDVLDQVAAYDLLNELSDNGSYQYCDNPDLRAQWRKLVRQGTILEYGKPIEVNFFRKLAGGTERVIDATELYIKSMQDVNMNVFAAADATGGSPGAATWITLTRSSHAGNGAYSLPSPGGSLYDFASGQLLNIQQVDTTTPNAHRVQVMPHRGDYTVAVKAGKPLLVNNARYIPGSTTTTPAASTTFMSSGYMAKVQPFHIRDDWKTMMELDKAWQEVLQLAVIFNKEGKAVDAWDIKARMDSRWNLQDKINQSIFVGQKITNSGLLSGTVDNKFPGFEGYDNVLKYGGGYVYNYARSTGFSPRNDLTSIMLRQDARKRSAEYIGMDGFAFRLAMQNRADVDFNNVSGACTFATFERMGGDKEDIKKLGIKSWHYGNITIHFKQFDALTDERYFGHGDFPYVCYLMPSERIMDTMGNMVSPIELYRPKGYDYYETTTDHRSSIEHTDFWSGYCEDVIMAAFHDVSNHIKIAPRSY